MIYWAAWAFSYVMLWVMLRRPWRGRLYCLLAVLAMGALAVLRGRVGTDTAAYEVLSSLIRQHGIFSVGVEPGFAALFLAFQEIGLNDILVVRLLAILDVLLLMVYVKRSTDDERYFLLTVFLPAFFYGYAMNELRIGWVSIVFLLLSQWVVLKKSVRWYHGAVAAGAILFHYSAVFYPVFSLAVFRKWSCRLIVRGGLVMALCALVAWLLTPAHFLEKIRLYQNYPAPSRLSGLSSVVQIGILLWAVQKSDLSMRMRRRLIGVSAALTVLFFAVIQFTYAGLRLLDLVVYSVALMLLCLHGLAGQRLNLTVKRLMLLFGLVSVLFIFRNFLNEPLSSYAPFLPYRTFLS